MIVCQSSKDKCNTQQLKILLHLLLICVKTFVLLCIFKGACVIFVEVCQTIKGSRGGGGQGFFFFLGRCRGRFCPPHGASTAPKDSPISPVTNSMPPASVAQLGSQPTANTINSAVEFAHAQLGLANANGRIQVEWMINCLPNVLPEHIHHTVVTHLEYSCPWWRVPVGHWNSF